MSVAHKMHDFSTTYQTKTDEELLQLAMYSEQLTPEAQAALASELASRRIDTASYVGIQQDGSQDSVQERRNSGAPAQHRVTEFIADVLKVYHRHFWFFVKLTGPAVVAGYIAVIVGNNEGRRIASSLPRGIGTLTHRTEILEIWFANFAGYLVSWMAFCFSFAAICSAMRQIGRDISPSFTGSFVAVRERMGAFVRLSMLLFLLVLVAVAASQMLSAFVLWLLNPRQHHLSHLTFQIIFFGFSGFAVLVVSRFGLSIPALVLDHYRVGQAMFLSDDLTKKKWITLAVLLAKSLVGSYLAGMCPFWLASWVRVSLQLPSWSPWVLSATSIAAVTVVEPTMFIGFALLYLRGSALSSSSIELHTRQLA